MRRLGFLIFVAMLASCLCFAGATEGSVSAAPNADNLADIQKRAQDELSRKAGQFSEEARQKARQSQGLLDQLGALRREAAEAQAQVKSLEADVKRLEKQGAVLKQEISNTGNALSGLVARLKARVVDMYKYSPQEGMNIFLSARDTHDALTAAYMLGRLARQDQGLIRELVKKSTDLTRDLTALEESRVQAQRQAAELKKRRAGLDTAIRKTDALLKDIRGQQRKAEAAARELAQAQQELGNRILALRNQRGMPSSPPSKPVQPLAPSPQPEPVGKTPPAPAPAPEVKRPQSYTWLPKGAALEWPLRGTITMPFGSRVHPVFRTKVFNSGIDIKAASGTPVRAAGPGEVLFRGWLRGFGQVVIIDHGGELSTVYGHLATTAVEEGDAVRTGSLVGTAGNSGTNTEFGLHFEVRRSGAAQNPLNYLRKS